MESVFESDVLMASKALNFACLPFMTENSPLSDKPYNYMKIDNLMNITDFKIYQFDQL